MNHNDLADRDDAVLGKCLRDHPKLFARLLWLSGDRSHLQRRATHGLAWLAKNAPKDTGPTEPPVR